MIKSKMVGCIDEPGYLNNFKRRGYTKAKCLLELTANSLDSFDKCPPQDYAVQKETCYDVGRRHTRIFDNAAGMTMESLETMFAMNSENHVTDSSRGVSGVGGKVAQSILGNQKLVKVFTHQRDGPYLCAVVPWDTMHKEGKYTGMIQIREMDDEEKLRFIQERTDRQMRMADGEAVGTTIEFLTNAELTSLIAENFTPIKDSTLTKAQDRMQIIFGLEKRTFSYKHYEGDGLKVLPLYNYFSADQSEYYCGYSRTVISQWERETESGKETLFVANVDDKELYFPKVGRGYAKDPEEVPMNLKGSGFNMVGIFEHFAGLRIDERIFDLANPRPLKAENILPTYDEPFLGRKKEEKKPQVTDGKEKKKPSSMNEEYQIYNKLIRNNQVIGTFLDSGTKAAHARAGAAASLKIRLVQSELRFYPKSRQDNPQDHIVGIQENKNQFSGENMPVNLTRLVQWLKNRKAESIWKMMQQKLGTV